MGIRGQGMTPAADDDAAEGSAAPPAQAQDIVYVLHPNCALEEIS